MRHPIPPLEPVDALAAAAAHLGRPLPLPRAVLPLPRWVEIVALGEGALEVQWNRDCSRPGTPARLALYVGRVPAAARDLQEASEGADLEAGGVVIAHRTAPLEHADEALRPVNELSWTDDGLHFRLTAQGPWEVGELLDLVTSIS